MYFVWLLPMIGCYGFAIAYMDHASLFAPEWPAFVSYIVGACFAIVFLIQMTEHVSVR